MFAHILKDSKASSKAWESRIRAKIKDTAPTTGHKVVVGPHADPAEKPTGLVDHYAKFNDPKVNLRSVLSGFSRQDRVEVIMMTRKGRQAKTSVEQFSTPHTITREDGSKITHRIYSPERQALHKKIIDGILTDAAVKAATPAPGERPTYIVLGGRGGSGKSKFTDGSIKEFDAKKFLVLDSDAIKQSLKPPYAGWNAFSVHEESSDIFDAVTVAAHARGLNILHDSTLRSDGIGSTIKQMKDSGYKIEGHYMFLSRQEAAKRAVKRYLQDGPENRGRLVPPEVVLQNTRNEANFQKLSKYFDKWSAYDNQGAKGSEPTKISGGGK
jgi:predicted ABC-type ATPase